MDITALSGNAHEIIALQGPTGITFNSLCDELALIDDVNARLFLWHLITRNESILFYQTNSPISQDYSSLPKVSYNLEKTLAIIEEGSSQSKAVAPLNFQRNANWKDVTGQIRSQSSGSFETHEAVISKYENSLRIVAKNPEVTQLNGAWDPLIPLPQKCLTLVNYLCRQKEEGGLSCGLNSPLNAAVGVKSTSIFHLKKISKVYNLLRWRRILVKKSRQNRNTASGTCAVLPRYVSSSFLLPDRSMNLARHLADYIVKSSPVKKTVELRHCTSALGWSGKQMRAIIASFPDYFHVGFTGTKPNDSQMSGVSDTSDDSRLSLDEKKGKQRSYKTITLQKQLHSLNDSLKKSAATQDSDHESDQGDAESVKDEDNDLVAEEPEGGMQHAFVTRSPLRILWESIANSGAEGMTLHQLRSIPNSGILTSMLRRYIKILVNSGYVKWANDQMGRQHVKRYYVISTEINLPSTVKIETGIFSRKRDSPINDSTSTISESPAQSVATHSRSIFAGSIASSARKQTIESTLTDRRALLLSEITAKLRSVDSKVHGTIDRRTVQRLCDDLVDHGHIGVYSLPLKSSGETIDVYTAFGVDVDDDAVKSAVARRDRSVKPIAAPVADTSELVCGPLRIRQLSSGRVALLQPKMTRAEALHSFLWYLTYGDGKTEDVTGPLASCAAKVGKPVKEEEMPFGWFRLGAVLDAMPLHLLALICPVSLAILPPTSVSAAINNGLTFNQLAPDLKASSLHTWGSFSLAAELRELVLVLNTLCLITFLERKSHSTSHLRTCLFVHRSTPVNPPRPSVETSRKKANKSTSAGNVRHFETFEDVANFWTDMRSESLNPTSTNSEQGGKSSPEDKTKKSRLAELCRLSCHVASFDAVPVVRPKPLGNMKGPGGSDSRIRLSVATHWNACKWAPVPRLDNQSQEAGMSSRRRTKFMALAGVGKKRRRSMTRAMQAKSDEIQGEDFSQPSTSAFGKNSQPSTYKVARKRLASANGQKLLKRAKKVAAASKKDDGAPRPIRRRRRIIRKEKLTANADEQEQGDDGKMYKTLQGLIDGMAENHAIFSADQSAAPKCLTDRDTASLALLTLHGCVSLSASRQDLESPEVPSFQDVRRASILPTIEVVNRSWVSHAVDLLIQLYPNQKRSTMVFQFVLVAIDLILSEKPSLIHASQPQSPQAMKCLWENIYSKFKDPKFHAEVFKRLVSSGRNVSNLSLTSNMLGFLRAAGTFWGSIETDLWSRMAVFTQVQYNQAAHAVEEDQRLRGVLAEQTVSAFLISTRLTTLFNDEALLTEPHLDLVSNAQEYREMVYDQLVAGNVFTIQRALAKLMSAKIAKRDFVDTARAKGFDEQAADAHIGEYSLSSNVRFQIASAHVVRCSEILDNIGGFIAKHALNQSTQNHLIYDLRSKEPVIPEIRAFTSPYGAIALSGAILEADTKLCFDLGLVPIDQLVHSSTTDAPKQQQSGLEITVWPLLLKVEANHFRSYKTVTKVLPSASRLRFPVVKAENYSLELSDNKVLSLLKERVPNSEDIADKALQVYRFVQSFGVIGCPVANIFTLLRPSVANKNIANFVLSKLEEAELVIKVGHFEERYVVTNMAESVWLMADPIMFPWPWSNADGSVNWLALRALLTSVTSTVMDWPGIEEIGIQKRLGPAISPVALSRLLLMLENAGVIEITELHVPRSKQAVGLFDEPEPGSSKIQEKLVKIYWVTSGGLLKLGVLANDCESRHTNG